jgi:selenophosphate synthetase-related protein
MSISLPSIPKPEGVELKRWLQSFPSFGYLLSVRPDHVSDVLVRFNARGIAAAEIGDVTRGTTVAVSDGHQREVIWDFARSPLIGCGPDARNIRKVCA